MDLKFQKNEKGEFVIPEADLLQAFSDVGTTAAQKATEAALAKMNDAFPSPQVLLGAGRRLADEKKWANAIKYFKALSMNDIATLSEMHRNHPSQKALNEATTTAGGYLVPTEFSDQLIWTMEQYGAARRYATVVKMNSKTFNLNSLTGKVTAYWTDEVNAITHSEPTFGEPVLTAKKLAGLTSWSSEIFEDSEIGIIENLVALYAEAFVGEEDNQFYNGSGSPFTGIFNTSTVAFTRLGGQSLDDLTYKKVVDITKSLSRGQLAGGTATWHMHRTVMGAFEKITDTQGRPILVTGQGSMPSTILGFPVEVNEKCPAASTVSGADVRFAAFGNLKPWTYFGDRRAIATKVLSEGTVNSNNLGEKDMEALRVTERVAITVAVGANIAVMATAE